MKYTYLIPVLVSLSLPTTTFAHPGRTDASGCHTCRTNCSQWGLSTGEYHCHTPKAVPQPLPQVTSTRNPSGVGVTRLVETSLVQEKSKVESTATVAPKPVVKEVPTVAAVSEYKVVESPKGFWSFLFSWFKR